MAQSFNPYLKWLGIPLKHQPPTFYRLLGVEAFEEDADIIERAADRQMTYLRSLQTGDRADTAQKLLNEVAAARLCLLDPDKKAEYDAKLRVQVQEQQLRPKPAPRVGDDQQNGNGSGSSPSASDSRLGVASAAPAVAAAAPRAKAPPKKPAKAASSSGVLKQAQPLSKGAPPAGGGAKPAPPGASAAVGAVPAVVTDQPASANATAASGAAKAGATGAGKTGPSMLPIYIGAGAGGGFLLLIALLAALAFWPGGGSDGGGEVALGGDANTQTNVGNENIGDGGATDDGEVGSLGSHLNNPDSGSGSNATDIDDEQNGGGNNTGGGNNNAKPPPKENPVRKAKGARLEVEAPFLTGTLTPGERVLSDRDYVFSKLASELEGLEFTRWSFGPVQQFRFVVERPGPVYMLVPPEQYARELPQIKIGGWTQTPLTCEIAVEGGRFMSCLVFKRASADGTATVSAGSAIWPIVAAEELEKKRRILGEIVDNNPGGNSGNPGGSSGTPSGGNNNPGSEEGDPEPGGGETAGGATQTVAKLAVPTSADQQPTRDRIDELYDIRTLREPEDKLRVAKNLLDVGSESSENHTERYVMLRTGADLAAEAGDLLTAVRAVDQIAADFDGDASALKLYLLRKFAKANVSTQVKASQLTYVVPIIDEGLANDHFDAVDKVIKDLLSARLKHPELAGRRKQALDMKDIYRKVAAAKDVLKSNPDDAAANAVVGEYLCFVKQDWQSGLSLLAKSDDALLRDVASKDAANPKESNEQLAVADDWYKLAESQDKGSVREKGALLTRAEDWYSKALPELKGLDEAHAKRRLEEIKAELSKIGWVNPSRKAIIAAASGDGFEMYLNGKKILSTYYYKPASTTVTLKRGDILMVHAEKSSSSFYSSTSKYYKGFGCVIMFEGARTPVVTGITEGWQAFVPNNTTYWYKPENIAKTVPLFVSPGVGHVDLAQQTGVGSRSIWYAGNSSEAYLLYRVP